MTDSFPILSDGRASLIPLFVLGGLVKTRVQSMLISVVAGLLAPFAVWAAPPADGGNVRVIIRFAEAPGKAQRDLVRELGGTVHHSFQIVPAIAATLPEQALAALAANPAIDEIEPDVEVQAHATEYDSVWGVTKIGCIPAHAGTYSGATSPILGAGIKVAVCDTGVDHTHPDLASRYKGGYDYQNSDSDPRDDNGHGTHVAGSIAAANDSLGIIGVAPQVDLYAVKVLGATGSGSFSTIIAALDWCTANGIQVANFSLGSSTDPGTTVKSAFDNAAAKGLIIVCSAGNSGSGADTVGYPGKYPSVIAVAATTSSDGWATYSSTGPAVDIAAPGSSIYSCKMGGGYSTMSGTSMASPHAAGAVALLLSAGIADSNGNGLRDEVQTLLQATAVDLGTTGFDNSFGYGRISVEAALTRIAGGTVPTPVRFDPPSNLTGTVAGTTVTLKWNDNSNNETGFEVQYGVPNKRGVISWSVWTTTAANATSFTGSRPSGNYQFRVRAKTGTSTVSYTAYSNTVQLKF